MELKINTEAQIITIIGKVSFKELLKTLKELNIDKDEWDIQGEVVQYYYPWTLNTPTYTTGTGTFDLSNPTT